MLTDKEKLEELLKEFGVEFSITPHNTGEWAVECRKGDTKVDGYSGFFTRFTFTADGKFKDIGAWE